jgi:cation transport regulator ChaC
MSDHWYFAYGSNLSTEQKESRTGPIIEARRARLDGYRIAFNKRGKDGTGKANIVGDPDGTVWGVVYRCSPAALDKMDTHEGVAGGHYARTQVRVRVDAGDELDAVTYIAGDSFVDNTLAPSKKYLETVLQGARDHDLPHDYVREVERAAHQFGGEPIRPA